VPAVYIAEKNAPTYNIANYLDAHKFDTFLVYLRTTHRDILQNAFQEVKEIFVKRWQARPDGKTDSGDFSWTLELQRRELLPTQVRKKYEEEKKRVAEEMLGKRKRESKTSEEVPQ